VVAERLALGEVGPQQAFLQPVLAVGRQIAGLHQLERQVQQPVGVHGVGRLGVGEVELQTLVERQRADPGVGLQAELPATAELLAEAFGQVPRVVGPGGRVELEGMPDDLGLIDQATVGQDPLQPSLTDVAPGADHVRPDVDAHASGNLLWTRPYSMM
jgi:hypothetical protein